MPYVTPTLEGLLDLYFGDAVYPEMQNPVNMHVTPDGVQFVAYFEGFVGQKYNDGELMYSAAFYSQSGSANGNCTVGYGHLIHMGPCSGSEGWSGGIGQTEALQLLAREVDNCAHYIPGIVNVQLSQNQYNIIAGLICNVGKDRFATYKFTGMLNQGLYEEAAQQLRATGIQGFDGAYYPGLIRRRAIESKMFVLNDVPLWPIPASVLNPN